MPVSQRRVSLTELPSGPLGLAVRHGHIRGEGGEAACGGEEDSGGRFGTRAPVCFCSAWTQTPLVARFVVEQLRCLQPPVTRS
jgi:hypothetical protein